MEENINSYEDVGSILKKKKLIIIGSILSVLVICWCRINPFGKFGYSIFAYTTYNAFPYPVSDIQIRSSGEIRKVSKTHELQLKDIQWLLDDKPKILIIGIGWSGRTKVSDEIKNIEGVEIHFLKATEARDKFEPTSS